MRFSSAYASVGVLVGGLLATTLWWQSADRARASSPTTTLPVTTSTGIYLGATEYFCDHHIRVVDPGPYESLELLFEGAGVRGFNTYGCNPVSGSSATVDEGYFYGQGREADHWASITGLDGLVGPTDVLDCESFDYWGRGDPLPDPVDFADFRVWAVGATGVGAKLPRVCVTGIECEDVRAQLDWTPEPICGDGDYDFRRSATDALLALGASVGATACTPDPLSCDIDDDGVVTATDALGMLQLAVGLPVDLHCPLPCLPGTIGPPGEDRAFEIEFSALLPLESRQDFRLQVDFRNADGVIPRGDEYSECEPQGDFGIAELQGEVGTLNAVIVPAAHANQARTPFLVCRFVGQGDGDPDPADFDIVTRDYLTGEPIEGLVGITAVRIPDVDMPSRD